MISLTELRAMLKKNKIRGYLHYNESELVDALIKRKNYYLKLSILQLSLHYMSEKIPRKKKILNIAI